MIGREDMIGRRYDRETPTRVAHHSWPLPHRTLKPSLLLPPARAALTFGAPPHRNQTKRLALIPNLSPYESLITPATFPGTPKPVLNPVK
jgi:hypothetical protein